MQEEVVEQGTDGLRRSLAGAQRGVSASSGPSAAAYTGFISTASHKASMARNTHRVAP